MTAVLRRHNRQIVDSISRPYVSKSANYTIKPYETFVNASISGGSFTLTLPDVSEAEGLVYTIRVTTQRSAATPYILTISDGGSSEHWQGNIKLFRKGQFAQLLSDGERWHRIGVQAGAPHAHGKYIHEMFKVPFVAGGGSVGGGPDGTAGSINTLVMANGNYFCYVPLGGGQTLLGPIWVNPGINVACDLTDNDGLEINHGVGADTPFQFVVGTDPAFFARLRFKIADVSGTDDCAFGFRKLEANQAAIDNYDEMAVMNIISGDIKIETILNNAATTTTDTTDNWADNATHSVTVKVSSAGVVTYEVDDADPTATAAFTFDAGEVVIPFFYFLHATTSPGAITLYEWEVGYQS